MIHLIVPFYVDLKTPRRTEIEESVKKNLDNTKIGSVTLCCEQHEVPAAKALVGRWSKGQVVPLPRRARYADLIKFSWGTDVIVIANADIYFDETISLTEYLAPTQVLCLTRAEQRPFAEGLYWPESETGLCHDAWVYRPPMNIPGDYEFGKPGCEIRFAGECDKAKYTLFNPCRQIHAMHHHTSGIRNYNLYGELQVGPPYGHVHVTPEWPLKPPVIVQKPPEKPKEKRLAFINECVKAQLSCVWTNRGINSMMGEADKQVAAMFDLAEKAAGEAERRGTL
jgi:hypothetical protein